MVPNDEALVFGFLMGCDHPDMTLETLFLIHDSLHKEGECQKKSAPSVPDNSTASSQDESVTQPFALIAGTRSSR